MRDISRQPLAINTGISLSTLALALAVPTPAHATPANAADAAPAAATAPTEEAPVIVVTGTAGGRGVNRLAASYAVTTVTASDLTKAAPKSSAEVLNLVPGVWVESSGGVAGANIMVRGLPSTGDAPFVSYQLMGSPVFATASLSFMENSSIFREDLTIRSVESVNGGTVRGGKRYPVALHPRPPIRCCLTLPRKTALRHNQGVTTYLAHDTTVSCFGIVSIAVNPRSALGSAHEHTYDRWRGDRAISADSRRGHTLWHTGGANLRLV